MTAGMFAHAQTDVVAHNLAVRRTGRGAPREVDGARACFIEAGDGRAGMGQGDCYAEPLPAVKSGAPSRLWHAAKVLYENDWLLTRF